jgi:predicted transposase/invertase (TIGR01784 family)
MKTDAIFYQLFQTLPDLFFELAGIEYSESYQFQAVELKQTAFRLDGIFVPKEFDLPLIFVEVQFQKDEWFYGRFFSEIMLYLYQQKPQQTAWRAVAIFPDRTIDNASLRHYSLLIPALQRIYLDEILSENQSTTLNLLGMIIGSEAKAIEIAKDFLQQPLYQESEFLLNTIETILLYKIPNTTREEIRKMINMTHVDITRTSWYQEGIEKGIEKGILFGKEVGKLEGKLEGKQQGEKDLLLRLLSKRFGKLKPTLNKKIEQLSLEELEQLTDDFLSLNSVEDLKQWLVDKAKL